MATYTLTPAERKARAQALKQTRENRFMYQKYLDERKKLEEQQAAEEQARLDEESRIKNQNFLIRGLSTVGDVVANVITGAVKGLEGIVDLGIGLVGAVGGIFDGDFQDRVKNVISYDWTGETFGNALQEALKYSYTTNGGIIENVANGIGQMLPAVLVTVATAGAGAPAAIAQGASLATLGISAAGNSTESAFQEGADYWAGLGYGAASGLVEVATEKMFGGATKALTGAGIFDGITKSVADTGVRRIAKNALEEGVEEVVSELANPALKSIYKGKDALNEYGTVEYWKGVGEAGLVGSLTALAYSGSVGYGMSKLGVGYVGKEADIADSLSEIDSLKKKAINLQANDELFGANEQKIADTTRKNYQNIEKTLKSVSEEKRANFIKKFDLGNAFNPDGTMSEKMSSWLNVEQVDTDNTNNSDSALASPKKDSYSFSLRGREAEIQNDLNRIREDLVKQYAQDKNASTEEAMQKVGELKVFSEEMSDKAKESRKKFNKGLNYLNKISGGDVAFVITEANDSFNGNLVDGRTIYIGEDTFENDSWSGTLVHEYTHFSEGSEEYNRLLNFLQSDDIVVADGIKLWEKGQNAVLNKNYGFDSNKIKSIKEKLDSGKPITQVEQRYYDNFATEVVAHETEYLLGNEEFIDRLVARESSLAQKVIKKIQNLSKMFNKVGDSQSKTQISQLKKAEKLYLKAASKAGEMRLVRMILSQDPELEREIDNSAEMQYNKKTRYSQYRTLATQWANNPKTNQGDIKILFNPDTNTYNKIVADSSYNVGYRVEKSVKDTAENAQKIEDLHREVYNEDNGAEQGTRENLHKNFEEYERQTRNFGDDLFDDKNEETNGQTRGVVEDESRGDGGGDYRKGRNDSRIVKYSLKDSEGRTLSQEQERFFRNSKVRDEDGNLLVMYHGTPNTNFTIFDNSKAERVGLHNLGEGYYFTRRKSEAEMHSKSFDADTNTEKNGRVIESFINLTNPYYIQSKARFYGLSTLEKMASDIGVEVDTLSKNRRTTINEYLKENGYDGVIYEVEKGTVDTVVAFFPSQIKNIDNKIPTPNDDIRYSFKDSEGRELSSQQQEYFKNSQVKDKEGNLLIVYHGSPSKFTKFSYQFMNTNGNAHGRGFYFTDNRDYAVDYQKENGQLLKGYLNIENPASESEITIKRNDIIKLIKAICQEEAKYAVENDGYESIKEALPDTFVSNYVDTYSQSMESVYNEVADTVLESSENDIDIIAELTNASSPRVVLPLIKNIVGYDGVIFTDETNGTNQFVAFTSNQFKNYDNETPTLNEDIRYQLKDNKQYFYELSDGQIKKLLADKTKMKVYSKAETEATVNTILETSLGIGEKYGKLSGKSKAEVIKMLWRGLNTAEPGKQMHVALDVAEYIIQNSVLENIYDDGENEANYFVVSVLKPYLHSLDLSGIKSDISYHYDRDNSPYLLWGKRRGDSGTAPDQLKAILEEQGFYVDSDVGADIFFQIDSAYREAVNSLKKKTKEVLTSALSSEERKELKNKIAREVLLSFDTTGKPSKLSKILDEYHKEARFWKEKFYDEKERGKARDSLFEAVDRVKGLEKYQRADVKLADEVLGLVKLLKKIKTYRGNLSKNVRQIMLDYSKEINGNKLYDLLANSAEGETNPFAETIERIAHANGELSTQEIKALDAILRNFIHNVNEYDRVFFEGRSQSETEIATTAITEINRTVKVSDSGAKGLLRRYIDWTTNPVNKFRRLGNYSNDSIIARIYNELQKGANKQSLFKQKVDTLFDDFMKAHKKELANYDKQDIEIGGAKMSKGQMISLYLTFLRQQGRSHLFGDGEEGIIRLSNEKAKKQGLKESYNKGEDVKISRATIEEIQKNFTQTDKDFILLAQKFFNGDEYSKGAIIETQEALYGVAMVEDDFYFPLRVAEDQIYKEIGNDNFRDLFTVYSPSFIKTVREGANNKVVIENVLDIIKRHTNQMAAYYGLAQPIRTFNRLLNKKVDGTNLRSAIMKADSTFIDYANKLLGDLQGATARRGAFDRVVGKVRSWGARAALGANPKVWVNQVVSLPAANAVGLKYKNLVKGFGKALTFKTDFESLFKYSPLAYERYRNGSNLDVGLLYEDKSFGGKFNKITDITTAPIQGFDKFTIGAIWNAALEQTKSKDYQDYSEDHYKKAAELTEKAITETQPNYTVLQRPEILRADSELIRLGTMFMTQPLQNLSLLASGIDKFLVSKKQLSFFKEGTEEYKKAKAQFEEAKKELWHKSSAVIVETTMLVAVAELFKMLLGKDDDKELGERILGDYLDSTIGMFPILKDGYSILQGYDISNMYYTGYTNIVEGVKDLYSVVDLVASGKNYDQTTMNNKVRKVVLGLSQTFGIPVRNIENYVKGIIGNISPATRLKYESNFTSQSTKALTEKLKSAVERGDDNLADTVVGLMLDEKGFGVEDGAVRNEIKTLTINGFNVLPKSVGKSITYDGEEIDLTKGQAKSFTEIYSTANQALASLVKLSQYESATDDIKAKAINYIYNVYYNLAIQDLLGVDLETKTILFAEALDVEKLAIIVSTANSLTADTDKKGNAISGSRKAKIQNYINSLKLTAVQKYMIMGYLGFKNTKGEVQVKAYINRLNLTKTEKDKLLRYSGYSG